MSECAICGRPGVTKWTFNNGVEAAIADLCNEHSQPFERVMELTRIGGARSEAGMQKRSRPRTPQRGRERLQPFNWSPPKR